MDEYRTGQDRTGQLSRRQGDEPARRIARLASLEILEAKTRQTLLEVVLVSTPKPER